LLEFLKKEAATDAKTPEALYKDATTDPKTRDQETEPRSRN
jgi:hypothetical protein